MTNFLNEVWLKLDESAFINELTVYLPRSEGFFRDSRIRYVHDDETHQWMHDGADEKTACLMHSLIAQLTLQMIRLVSGYLGYWSLVEIINF